MVAGSMVKGFGTLRPKNLIKVAKTQARVILKRFLPAPGGGGKLGRLGLDFRLKFGKTKEAFGVTGRKISYHPAGSHCNKCKRPAAGLVRLGEYCTYMVKPGSRTPCEGVIILPRQIKREETNRYGVDSKGRHFLICKSWYFLDDGVTKYCYIHVYRNSGPLPIRWWRWIEHLNGTWEWAP